MYVCDIHINTIGIKTHYYNGNTILNRADTKALGCDGVRREGALTTFFIFYFFIIIII